MQGSSAGLVVPFDVVTNAGERWEELGPEVAQAPKIEVAPAPAVAETAPVVGCHTCCISVSFVPNCAL